MHLGQVGGVTLLVVLAIWCGLRASERARGNPFNAYLLDQVYPLNGGGFLLPAVPEPSTLASPLIVTGPV